MSKTSGSRFFVGILMALLVSIGIPVASATSPVLHPSVNFGVGANDFPDHHDYNKIELVPNAFVNVYTISNDSTLGYYKGTLKETLETGPSGLSATAVVPYGEMVDFLTFKSKTLAQSSSYSTYKFSTPPYKNFGNDSSELCQTNFFAFDQYLKNDQNYACATSLSTPYTGGSTDVVLGAPQITSPYANQVLTNYPRTAYISWTAVSNASSYDAEVACDTCTSTTTKWLDPITYSSSTNYLTTKALAGDNGFRVRVRASNGNTKGDWSDFVYFSYKTSSSVVTTLGAPQITSPYANQVLTNYPRTAYISWTAVSNASSYDAEVACDTCTSTTTKWLDPITFSSSTNYLTTKALAGDNGFRVRVRASNGSTKGAWSDFVYFSYKTSSSSGSGKVLPPAGYEDQVLTKFDSYQNPFSDTSLNTLEGQAAAELYRRGVIGGFPDGEFKGNNLVNRAELAKFLLLARFASVDEVANNGQFGDVLDGAWYVKFVVTAAKKGVINGYTDGRFKPGNSVNVAEFLKMLSLTFDLKTNLPYSYLDVSVGDWFAQFAGAAKSYNLFPNKNNYLNPGDSMTRNEVAVAIYEFLLNK